MVAAASPGSNSAAIADSRAGVDATSASPSDTSSASPSDTSATGTYAVENVLIELRQQHVLMAAAEEFASNISSANHRVGMAVIGNFKA